MRWWLPCSAVAGWWWRNEERGVADREEALKKYAEIEAQEEENEKDYEDRLVEELATHGKQDNISFFAFTATPKAKTLELFGTKQENGSFTPYHVYSMNQLL